MPSKIDFENTRVAFKALNKIQLSKYYMVFGLMNHKSLVNIGTFLIEKALGVGLPIKKIIKNTIFDIFCGGQDIEDCQNRISYLAKAKIGTILDYSVEGKHDEESFELTKAEIINTVTFASKSNKEVPFAVFKLSGLGSALVMEHPSTSAFEAQSIENRFFEVIDKAVKANIKILIDAEETWIQDFIDDLALKAMLKYNKPGKTIIFNTYQFYRKNAFKILQNHHTVLKANQASLGVKIVRGAYLEKERERALALSYEDPINETKEATDSLFNIGVKFCFQNIDDVEVCLGTHNIESTQLAVDLINSKGLQTNDSRIYFAQLLGMCDVISYNLANNNYNVAKYVPYGPIADVMPYLIRRAKENTAMAGQSSREFSLIKKEVKRRFNE